VTFSVTAIDTEIVGTELTPLTAIPYQNKTHKNFVILINYLSPVISTLCKNAAFPKALIVGFTEFPSNREYIE
jgi:hypothetical protein